MKHMNLHPNPTAMNALLAANGSAYDTFHATLGPNAKVEAAVRALEESAAKASANSAADSAAVSGSETESPAAASDRDGAASDVKDDSYPHIYVRLESDTATYSVNASGIPLYKRGYKQLTSDTPMRETMAAALVRQAMSTVYGLERSFPPISRAALSAADAEASVNRYTPIIPHTPALIKRFWDPFAGSGTVVIEAFLANYPHSLLRTLPRHFAFEDWASHDPARYKRVLRQLITAYDAADTKPDDTGSGSGGGGGGGGGSILDPAIQFIGSDVSARAVEIANANAKAAGADAIAPRIRFETGDFEAIGTGCMRRASCVVHHLSLCGISDC